MAYTPSYYGDVSGTTEPDMRQEIINTLDGKYPEVAKGKTALLRKFRLDSNGNKTLCSCIDAVTGEPDKDFFCPISAGERWLWDETKIKVYKVVTGIDSALAARDSLVSPGLLNIPIVVFYMRYDSGVTQDDKIVEIALDSAGTASSPLRRTAIYRIQTLIEYRADRGRIEYYKAACSKENVRYLNAPGID